jgi:hypothetical protein
MSTTSQQIDVYEGNDLMVIVNVTGISSLAGYTPKFTLKASKDATSAIFEVTGSFAALQITFNITAAQNSIDWDYYWYEVTIESGSTKYTLAQDVYKVLESIVYHETGT